MRILIAFFLPLATFSFALGITLPLMRFERLYFLEDRPSLLQIVGDLWSGNEPLLAVVVSVFSLALPAAKIFLTHIAALSGGHVRHLALLSTVSKWSMLDVMLVALVLFAAKTSGLAEAAALPGLWFYAAASLMTALSAFLAGKLR
ncbi:paraquat-inducible protein A [Roseibium hamelinense]|uniref:Paraquat-inducible protein A n=1 Tax=Roseibium hamelinense TaxID=150831 RepID=A0A562SM11_9HYPH|nr:paraquat-inducible protein A [Roseibium hamelinense]MTI44927.1 paraquat-inducible protein A [Roseibium hamelinense]TWI82188.1 paraquat-inducible protein A [Roseibium hamelinense]